MTDYSQLNHDEPTHWTKPATTPTEQQVVETEPDTTEPSGVRISTTATPSDSESADRDASKRRLSTTESGTTTGDDLVAVGAVEALDKDGSALTVGGIVPLGEEAFLPLVKEHSVGSADHRMVGLEPDKTSGDETEDKVTAAVETPTASIGTIRTEAGTELLNFNDRDRLTPAFGTPRLEASENVSVQDPIDKLARDRDDLGGAAAIPEFQKGSIERHGTSDIFPSVDGSVGETSTWSAPSTPQKYETETDPTQPDRLIRTWDDETGNVGSREDSEAVTGVMPQTTGATETSVKLSSFAGNNTDFFKDQNTDFTSEIASIEAKDDNLISNMIPSDKDEPVADENEASTKRPIDDSNNTEQFFRYDIIEDIRNLFSNDNDVAENEVKDNQLDDMLGFKGDDKVATEDTLIVQRIEDGGYETSYQEEEQPNKEEKRVIDSLVVPTVGEKEANYETPFSEWGRESEEQEHNMENIVFQTGNESEMAALDLSDKNGLQGAGWFLLLLSGNATIVQKRQKDFAKYLKLNLAARLSLEYDELRVNKVVLLPPRLMVNVSVVPSENDNFDEEFDLNERLFGEEEAPLHKLAETNATLLELSGEEYHVVRFLSPCRAQPITMEETAAQQARKISDRHGDIDYLIYIVVGGPCLSLLAFLVYTLYRLYLLPKNDWPWQRDKPIFSTGPRHRRMNDSNPFAKPLTVIYSGSFVDRNGPPSGSWLDDNYRPEQRDKLEPSIENPSYGLGSLSKNALSEICEPSVLDSPRFNVRMMGCQPAHLLLPRTPVKKPTDPRPSRGPTEGLDNPNYLT